MFSASCPTLIKYTVFISADLCPAGEQKTIFHPAYQTVALALINKWVTTESGK
jgi:hypothetical protein